MIRFTRESYDAMVAHAREGAPQEVCGVLGGRLEAAGDSAGADESTASVVSTVRRADNDAAAPRSTYEIAPAEQLSLMDAIEADGEDVVGFYHSHPQGPPRPSRTDAAQATWAGRPYVIVVLDGETPFVGSWRWTGETFVGERVALSE
jgi:proteasome lid subunit RPN8/RPN11